MAIVCLKNLDENYLLSVINYLQKNYNSSPRSESTEVEKIFNDLILFWTKY